MNRIVFLLLISGFFMTSCTAANRGAHEKAENADHRILSQIENIVVIMLENRSFDNLAGWLYDKNTPPKKFIMPVDSAPDHYDGLAYGSFSNPNIEGKEPASIPIKFGTDNYTVPSPDPHEEFQYVTEQLYGNMTPTYGDKAPMNGFVRNYASVPDSDPAHIMQTYTPEQLPVLSAIARNFAISDRWFASVPTQTLANRAFLHSGTSEGNVNNSDNYVFHSKTIFNVLSDYDVSWKVYSDSGFLPSLTRIKMSKLWSPRYHNHFFGFENFIADAKAGSLPSYSFIEPKFIGDTKITSSNPNSEHPPTNISAGDQFLAKIYNAVFNGPDRNKTILIVTYDEHGGIYDHVSPPWGAKSPDNNSNPGKRGFHFDRFGVRIPTIIVSPWIEEGTVFRSFSTPYDHTSIIATIMDWQGIPRNELPSKRVAAADNIANIFTLSEPRKLPVITLPDIGEEILPADNSIRGLTGLERGVIGAYMKYIHAQADCKISHSEIDEKLDKIKHHGKIQDYIDELQSKGCCCK